MDNFLNKNNLLIFFLVIFLIPFYSSSQII